MKIVISTLLVVGVVCSVPSFAEETSSTVANMNMAQPHDLVPVQLLLPDGTKATVYMKRYDAKKFHKTKEVERKQLEPLDMTD